MAIERKVLEVRFQHAVGDGEYHSVLDASCAAVLWQIGIIAGRLSASALSGSLKRGRATAGATVVDSQLAGSLPPRVVAA